VHPFPSFNAKYLTVEARHSGNQAAEHAGFRELMRLDRDDVYHVEIDAISAKTQFRAESLTAWPRIYGYENGVVDGPADTEYAQIDEQGRYNCKFKFDESTLKGGNATTWVRMMQPHGGDIEGFHFPLRRGTEVVLSFLGGDCDRPVIFGVVPNAVNPSAVTEANYTKNVIQTGSRNRLELEDLAGAEWIRLSTPFAATQLYMGSPSGGDEMILRTDGNGFFDVKQTQQFHTGSWREDHVKSGYFNTTVDGTVTDVFNGTHTTTVKGLVTETYEDGQTTTVDAALRKATYNVGQQTTVNGALTKETYNVGHDTTVHTGQKLTVTGGQTIHVTGGQTITVVAGKTETVTGQHHHTVNGPTVHAHNGPVSKTTTGSNSDIRLDSHFGLTAGAKADIFAGAAFSGMLGINTGITAGVDIKLTAALALYLELGFAMKLNLATTVSVAPFESKLNAFKEDSFGAKLQNAGAKINMHGIEQHLTGLFVAV
jgi:type VI secretion system secreted protein VgrG